jgi:hypothetical protein
MDIFDELVGALRTHGFGLERRLHRLRRVSLHPGLLATVTQDAGEMSVARAFLREELEVEVDDDLSAGPVDRVRFCCDGRDELLFLPVADPRLLLIEDAVTFYDELRRNGVAPEPATELTLRTAALLPGGLEPD